MSVAAKIVLHRQRGFWSNYFLYFVSVAAKHTGKQNKYIISRMEKKARALKRVNRNVMEIQSEQKKKETRNE